MGFRSGSKHSSRSAGGHSEAVVPSLLDRLRADLTHALRARDQVAVTAIRTLLAAFANAEAPPIDDHDPPPAYGRLVDHPRLELSDADLERILRDEIADRQDTVSRFLRGGREAEAEALRAEIAVLETYLA
jgi:uncharacterized protein YqeY